MTETVAEQKPAKVSTYISQHCQMGNCEGTQNKSKTGAKFHSCHGEYRYRGGQLVIKCSHKCHEDMRKLRQLAGIPEPDYEQSFAVPSSKLAGLSHSVREPVSGDGDGATSIDVRASLARHSEPPIEGTTESGRLQRGVLEQRVYELCKAGTNINVKTLCTFIGMRHGDEPSAGAVTAVLRRWQSSGLAKIDDNPVRFVEFSDQVKSIGLWEAKEVIVRAGRRAAKGHW